MSSKVLVACEESQAVTKAFRKRGIEAYSCDILPCSGGHPEWHIQDDVLKHINDGWDLMVAHPPCTYLSASGARWLYNKDGSKNTERFKKREEALIFAKALIEAPIKYCAIENPVGMLSSLYRKPDQVIHPNWFGDPVGKSTCLWLKNLPILTKTNVVPIEYTVSSSGRRWEKWFFDSSCISDRKERSRVRSKTFTGIAEAMADQWGPLV